MVSLCPFLYRLSGHEFEQAPGVGDGQGSLACFSPWGHKESDITEQLNRTDLYTKDIDIWQNFLNFKIIKDIKETRFLYIGNIQEKYVLIYFSSESQSSQTISLFFLL